MIRAQIAIEYVFVQGFALLILIGLLTTLLAVQSRTNEDIASQQAEDIAAQIQQELVLASSVHNGYERTVVLPANIQGQDYSIELAASAVYVRVGDYNAIQPIPSVNGTMSPGENTITNTGGVQVN